VRIWHCTSLFLTLETTLLLNFLIILNAWTVFILFHVSYLNIYVNFAEWYRPSIQLCSSFYFGIVNAIFINAFRLGRSMFHIIFKCLQTVVHYFLDLWAKCFSCLDSLSAELGLLAALRQNSQSFRAGLVRTPFKSIVNAISVFMGIAFRG